MDAALKILAGFIGLLAAWYFKGFFTLLYQKYLDFKAANELDAAKKKAEADSKKFGSGIKNVPRGP